MEIDTNSFLITKDLSVKQVMKRMTDIGQRVLFVVDDKKRLKGSLSDGDVRKWILSGGNLNEKVFKVCNRKPKFVKEKYHIEDIKQTMLDLVIESVPVVKDDNGVVKILTWEHVFADKVPKQKKPLDIQIIIMAGGKGARLEPFTKILPKPLIPIGDKPIIEIIMDKFGEYGIKDFFISINHKSRMIKSYFEETNDKYSIHYIEENKPLGTAGCLRFLRNKVKESFLIANCDIIIEANYTEIVKFHKDNDYDMTLVVSCRHYVIPYGVCEIENGGILKYINEKPEYDFLVNTGMYVMKRGLLDLIPRNQSFNFDKLISKAKDKGYKIGVFPISESSWIDIGQWKEYHKTLEKMQLEL